VRVLVCVFVCVCVCVYAVCVACVCVCVSVLEREERERARYQCGNRRMQFALNHLVQYCCQMHTHETQTTCALRYTTGTQRTCLVNPRRTAYASEAHNMSHMRGSQHTHTHICDAHNMSHMRGSQHTHTHTHMRGLKQESYARLTT
jgi:hypothetical protein